MALEQAFLHEFAHIGNGHNDYLSTLNLLSLTDRPYHPVAAEKDSLLLQTLEMDADATGLMYTLELNERKRLDLPKYADRLDDAKRIANIAAFGAVRAYIRNILFSNYVFWRCKDQVWDLEKQPHDDHPQPAIRMKFLRDGLARCLLAMPHLGYSPNDFITDSREIIQSAEIACARIMHVEPQLEVYQSAFQTADAVHYFEKLEDYWCKIRHSLMKYPKVRMLAPCNLPHNHALI